MATFTSRPAATTLDGFVRCRDSSWANVLIGVGTAAGFNNGSTLTIGTNLSSGTYEAAMAGLGFDLSDPALTGATITAVDFEATGVGTVTAQTGYILEYDMGVVTNLDYQINAALSLYTILGTLSLSGSTGTNSYSLNSSMVSAVQAAIGTTLGVTFTTKDVYDGTAPSSNKQWQFRSSEHGTSSERPALIITYTTGGTEHPLQITIAASSTTTSDFTRVVDYAAAVAGVSSLAAVLSKTLGLSSSVAASSALTSDLERTAELASSITSVSSLDTAIEKSLGLTASVTASSSLTSDLERTAGLSSSLSAVSVLTSLLNQEFSLVSDISASSTVTSVFDLNAVVHEFIASLSASGLLTEAIYDRVVEFQSQIDASFSLTSDFTQFIEFVASLVAASGLTSSFGLVKEMEAEIVATSSITNADLDIFKEFLVSLSMSSSVSPALERTAEFQAELNATGTLTPGLLALTKAFKASLDAHGNVNPELTRPLRFNRNNTKVTPKAVVEFRA